MSRILIQSKNNAVLLEEVIPARKTCERMRGLLGRSTLSAGCGMWIKPCRSIHMWFMRFSIDAVFLDREMRVLKVVQNLKPWQLAFAPRGTCSVLETTAGGLRLLEAGDQLYAE